MRVASRRERRSKCGHLDEQQTKRNELRFARCKHPQTHKQRVVKIRGSEVRCAIQCKSGTVSQPRKVHSDGMERVQAVVVVACAKRVHLV